MKKRNLIYKSIVCLVLTCSVTPSFAQAKNDDAITLAAAPQDRNYTYQHNTNSGAQWYPAAGLGMFIHWGIASVKELDLSWPMMSGTQIGWCSPKMEEAEVKKIMDSGDYFAGHACKNDNSCITPNEYFALAKDFNPKSFDADKLVKAAKDAGMTYAVLTVKHHDGFALWPSKYGDFNTKNYLGGRDFVREYVNACRKYGLKVGLYFSPPDWHYNGDFQNFIYYGLKNKYPNLQIPVLDRNLQPRTTAKTNDEWQAHYDDMATYIKGQVEELLTNYGKIDLLWFDTDGVTVIPKGNPAWDKCISIERIRQLQPGIVFTPRFYGQGDYKTFEGDGHMPTEKQDGWAELCSTIATGGWGYTKAPLKSTAYVLNQLAICRSNNSNFLLNFGPNKDGVFSNDMINRLQGIGAWMKVNKVAVTGAKSLEANEQSSVPATASGKHRYLFVMPDVTDNLNPKLQTGTITATFKSNKEIKHVGILGKKENLKYSVNGGIVAIQIPSGIRSANGDVIDIELK